MTAFTPAQVCEELGIQDSTLRKYSLLLEKEGVSFERHKNNRRIYTEKHVITLKRSLNLMHNDDITLEKAMQKAVGELKVHPVIEASTVTEQPLQRNDSDITAILIEEIRGLKQQLSEQEERQKQRDSLFVEALEELQTEIRSLKEERTQLTAPLPAEPEINAVESSPQAAPVKQKGFLARLFKKRPETLD